MRNDRVARSAMMPLVRVVTYGAAVAFDALFTFGLFTSTYRMLLGTD